MPSIETDGLITNCFLKRNSSNEVLISNNNKTLNELIPGSIVGTSSFRREFQLRKFRKDLNFKLIRGNVDTRIQKLKQGEYDAIILSKAGLKSLNREKEITQEFTIKELIPSVGQGTIAVQCRKDDREMIELLEKINHQETNIRVRADREVLKALEGDCETAVGAISEIKDNKLHLSSELFSISGDRRYYYETTCDLKDFQKAGMEVGNNLKEQSKGNYKK